MKHLKISLYTAILSTTLNGKKTTIIIIQTNSILERYYVTNTHHQAAKIESIVITMLGGFSTLFGHFMKSLISHFYTAACKFKVKRSDSQNFDEKKLPGRCVSPLFGSILSRYQFLHKSYTQQHQYQLLHNSRHKTPTFGFELLYNLILDRSRILCNGIYVYLVCIYNYLFTYVMFMCVYSSVFYNL